MADGASRKKATKRANRDQRRASIVQQGSGNVFADLGLPNPDLALAKAELVQRIRAIISDRKLTQAQAAEILKVDQPKVSAIVRGRVAGYSLDRLIRFLTALGQQVEISVRPAQKGSDERPLVVK